MASAVSTTEASTSSIENELCRVRARSRIARSFAEIAADPAAASLFGRGDLFHQPLQLRAVEREDELVANPARRSRCGRSCWSACVRDALAVDERAVAAVADPRATYSPSSATMRACVREARVSRR